MTTPRERLRLAADADKADWVMVWRQDVRALLSERKSGARDHGPRKAGRMHQTTVFLAPEQREHLRALATRLGVSVGALVREGIELVCDREGL